MSQQDCVLTGCGPDRKLKFTTAADEAIAGFQAVRKVTQYVSVCALNHCSY